VTLGRRPRNDTAEVVATVNAELIGSRLSPVAGGVHFGMGANSYMPNFDQLPLLTVVVERGREIPDYQRPESGSRAFGFARTRTS
jgi:hypothetical protein